MKNYENWLENMVVMLSKNYMDLIKASEEEVLKKCNLPHSNETRKAIRLISENTCVKHDYVDPGTY